jgi:hypothetical protein
MRNKIGIAIAAIMLMGCATITDAEVITGFTTDNAPACVFDDLSTENMDLISEWARVNRLQREDALTDEDRAIGQAIHDAGNCGLLRPGTPVTIVLSDGTIYLLRFPDGMLMGVVDSGFTETASAPRGKEFKVDDD